MIAAVFAFRSNLWAKTVFIVLAALTVALHFLTDDTMLRAAGVGIVVAAVHGFVKRQPGTALPNAAATAVFIVLMIFTIALRTLDFKPLLLVATVGLVGVSVCGLVGRPRGKKRSARTEA